MRHLSKDEIAVCKKNLERIEKEQTAALQEVDKEISMLKKEKKVIPETLEKKKTKIEGILCATKKSFEQMDNGTYGLDISSGQPIPFATLEIIPYIKVRRTTITPPVTCNSGAGHHSYGNH